MSPQNNWVCNSVRPWLKDRGYKGQEVREKIDRINTVERSYLLEKGAKGIENKLNILTYHPTTPRFMRFRRDCRNMLWNHQNLMRFYRLYRDLHSEMQKHSRTLWYVQNWGKTTTSSYSRSKSVYLLRYCGYCR